MDSQSRPPADHLTKLDSVQREPYRHDFLDAMRRIECAYATNPRIGASLRSSEDPIRFCQTPSLAFAPTTIDSFTPASEDTPPRLHLYSFGMFGPNGPLPLHLTEFARDRQRNSNDWTLRRFIDVFHHRMISLFYRGWASAQPTVQFDRPDDDRFADYIGSFIGIGMESLRKRDAVPDLAKLFFSGHLICQTRPADGLESILSGYFQMPVHVEQFVGRWMPLPDDCLCRVGESPRTGLLGSTAIVGSRIWECQQKFRVRFGPLTLKQYQRLLPQGRSLHVLIDWIRNYLSDTLEWDLNLVLLKEEVPETRLGTFGQLGWTTWLATEPLKNDADRLIFDPVAYFANRRKPEEVN